ncbi:CCA tRNA nucleotidyltransferase, mitochondrial [Didymosphaeria variabile]|uniref:CCA tRNA nucleotidyltransferase, mitochondrial n=1 Tax=Didymosphaeria variabile TaxID=1932322 RepID=A0A9W9C9U7_9PLEO|nr:CCA tRNA nucleotidyltransferase, mitochondrial [Didymosphaeria variabile]KAJ4351730.1 CCA tRNA nucleotidyltransferase, mitochondrial [Didymosphaeria variabile]
MPAERLPSPVPQEQPAPKRRKTGPSEPHFVKAYSGMASRSYANPTTLELTEEETKLRNLLLAVASYIDQAPPSDGTGVSVAEEVAQEKVVLRWTGGWVRDKLLGVGSHDVDVAINKTTGENFGLKMLEYLKIPGNLEKHDFGAAESGKIMSGLHTIKANPEASKNLETATIKVMGIDLDLVNLRKETYDEVSRNPQMEFGTAEEDAMRRDATVNAMFYNLNTQQIEDFTDRGFDDMAAKIIRTPLEPYQTFKDDPLRVLRLIRFASRLNYTLDPETAKAMANKDIQEALKIKIKRERVGIEMEKMLKGPDPGMALRLIDEASLHDTIFTDPTRTIYFQPDIEHYRKGYQFMTSWIKERGSSKYPIIPQTLLSTRDAESDEEYLAWVCAAVLPWADAPQVPPLKKNKQPLHAAYLVAQEGLKAPNRVCDVIAASLNNYTVISQLVGECQRRLGKEDPASPAQREKIGMALRSWGRTWRSQVFFALLHEIVYGDQSTEDILRQYANFLTLTTDLDLLDVINLKPLLKGTELATALGTKPGPWMKDALDVVLAWQLRNPSVTDPSDAIKEVKKTSKSELPSRLISHFLTLTIRPLFSQAKTDGIGDTPTPWKTREHRSFLDLLQWCIKAADEKDLREWFRLMRPPIFRMLEDSDLQWKAKACQVIAQLVRKAPENMKEECRDLFAEDLFGCFNYLPTLTPAQESAQLLEHVYPALISFVPVAEQRTAVFDKHARDPAEERHTNSAALSDKNFQFLDKIVRQGVIAVLHHAPTPTTYPELTTLVLQNLSRLIIALEIEWVKHANDVLPLLHDILRDTFSPAHPNLPLAAVKCLQACIAKGWPRMDTKRMQDMYLSVATAWVDCSKYDNNPENLEALRGQLKESVMYLERAFYGKGLDVNAASWWTGEKERARKEKAPWEGGLDYPIWLTNWLLGDYYPRVFPMPFGPSFADPGAAHYTKNPNNPTRNSSTNSTGQRQFKWTNSSDSEHPNSDSWYLSVSINDTVRRGDDTSVSNGGIELRGYVSVPDNVRNTSLCVYQFGSANVTLDDNADDGMDSCGGLVSDECKDFIKDSFLHESVGNGCPLYRKAGTEGNDAFKKACPNLRDGPGSYRTDMSNTTCATYEIPSVDVPDEYHSYGTGSMSDAFEDFNYRPNMTEAYDLLVRQTIPFVCVTPNKTVQGSRAVPEGKAPWESQAVGLVVGRAAVVVAGALGLMLMI